MNSDSGITAAPAGKMAKWRKRLPAIFFLGAVSYMFLRGETFSSPAHVDLPVLDLHRLDGSTFNAHQLAGKPLVVNFWAPWCPPCRLELPWLQDLQKKHPEITVLGIEDDADEYGNAIDLAAHAGISYPMIRASVAIREVFGNVSGLPTTFYIAPSGRVVHTVNGVIPESLMQHYADDAAKAR